MNHALDIGVESRLQDVANAVYVGGKDLLRAVKRERGRGVDDQVHAFHSRANSLNIANVAIQNRDGLLFWIFEGGNVQRYQANAPLAQIAHKIDSQESGASCDQPRLPAHQAGHFSWSLCFS